MPAPGTSGKMPQIKKTVTGVLRHTAKMRDIMVSTTAAAKEAMVKALGTGFRDALTPKSVSVENDGLGAPFAVLGEAARKRLEEIGARKMLVSLSHLKEYAQAFAVATR